MIGIPKPEPRARAKRRTKRRERKIVDAVRARCVERDGRCRLAGVAAMGACVGASEWAHLGEKRRWKTRGMEPEERHTSRDSLMLCDGHHNAYDDHSYEIEKLDADGADGRLRYVDDDGAVLYEEPPR